VTVNATPEDRRLALAPLDEKVAAAQPAESQPAALQRREDRVALAAAARPCRLC
jgi:hypothetical protein